MLRATIAAFLLVALSVGPAIGNEEQPRLRIAQARKLVRAHIFKESPKMDPSARFPIVEVTSAEVWKQMKIQVFKVTDGVRECQAYMIEDNKVRPLGGSFGGPGLMSMTVADLDGDGSPELVYTHSWGSGRPRSLVGVYSNKDGKPAIAEAPFAFQGGDVFVKEVDEGGVIIEIGRYGWKFNQWTSQRKLGTLRLTSEDGDLKADVELADDLPEEVKSRIWR